MDKDDIKTLEELNQKREPLFNEGLAVIDAEANYYANKFRDWNAKNDPDGFTDVDCALMQELFAIRDAIADKYRVLAFKEETENEHYRCTHCYEPADKDDVYCRHCGAKFLKENHSNG
jgi:ABC-type metal ion transport system substrate-binding protein